MTVSKPMHPEGSCPPADPPDRWQHYADFYRDSAYAVFQQRHRGLEGQLPFRMIEVEQHDHDFTDPNVPEAVLALPLAASADNRWSWNMGDGWKHDRAAPGNMLMLPASVESRWKVVGQRKLLLLALPSDTIGQISQQAPERTHASLQVFAQRTWRDSLVEGLMLRLWEASRHAQTTDRLLADGILLSLVLHLLQRTQSDPVRDGKVTLPAWRLRRVTEFVDAHLAERLDVSRLAAAAGLSERHFARAFRQEVGETPHQWVMKRRIERATHWLAHSDMPLEQIAAQCGFVAMSHFGRMFKVVTGETPRRWQNLHRGSAAQQAQLVHRRS
jgi:AraC family transcriptional regulator